MTLFVIKSQHLNWLSKIQFMPYSINTIHSANTNGMERKTEAGEKKRTLYFLTHFSMVLLDGVCDLSA